MESKRFHFSDDDLDGRKKRSRLSQESVKHHVASHKGRRKRMKLAMDAQSPSDISEEGSESPASSRGGDSEYCSGKRHTWGVTWHEEGLMLPPKPRNPRLRCPSIPAPSTPRQKRPARRHVWGSRLKSRRSRVDEKWGSLLLDFGSPTVRRKPMCQPPISTSPEMKAMSKVLIQALSGQHSKKAPNEEMGRKHKKPEEEAKALVAQAEEIVAQNTRHAHEEGRSFHFQGFEKQMDDHTNGMEAVSSQKFLGAICGVLQFFEETSFKLRTPNLQEVRTLLLPRLTQSTPRIPQDLVQRFLNVPAPNMKGLEIKTESSVSSDGGFRVPCLVLAAGLEAGYLSDPGFERTKVTEEMLEIEDPESTLPNIADDMNLTPLVTGPTELSLSTGFDEIDKDYPSGLSISDFADDPCPVELEESPKRSHSNTIRNYAQVSDAGRGWSQRKNQMCTGNNLMFGGNSFSSIRPNPTLYRGNMPMLPIQNMGGSGMSERRTTYTCSYSPRIQNTVGPNSFYIPNQMPQSCGSTSPQIPMPFQGGQFEQFCNDSAYLGGDGLELDVPYWQQCDAQPQISPYEILPTQLPELREEHEQSRCMTPIISEGILEEQFMGEDIPIFH